MKKIKVIYLFYGPYGKIYLLKFLKKYKKFSAGLKHELIICCKNVVKKKIIKEIKKKKVQCKIVEDFYQDYDLQSFYRIAKKNKGCFLFFLGTKDFPNKKNWLKFCYLPIKNNKIVTCTSASMQGHPNIFFNFLDTRIGKLKSIYYGLVKLLFYPSFPNPHIRTTGFLINSNLYVKTCNIFFNKKKIKNFNTKESTLQFESGRYSFYKILKRLNVKVFLINAKNFKFSQKNWKFSKTFFLDNQSELLIKDHRAEWYDKQNLNKKKKLSEQHWGYF